MTRQLKNKIRTLVLLTVYSLNTVLGFGCSVGVDMGYNTHHHAQGEKHSHKHNHLNSLSVKFSDAGSKEDCCSNDVTRFSLLDKSVAANNLLLEASVFLLLFASTFLSQSINESGLAVNSKFQFVRRSSFLNNTDIQTAIRRFQI